MLRSILVTGGAGFIGSNFVRYLIEDIDYGGTIVVLDKLTYAGSTSNLPAAFSDEKNDSLHFRKGDIGDKALTTTLLRDYSIDVVINFAAESHVDRSIAGSRSFVETNIVGVHSLLDVAREVWGNRKDVRFHQVSTDEVFGSLGSSGVFTEQSSYSPRSPYAATKAAADHLVASYHTTYGVPTSISYCSNNYGPHQHPEKLIPLMISRMRSRQRLPIYGDGSNVRDWIHVSDHCKGLWKVLAGSEAGSRCAFGGRCELSNLELVRRLASAYGETVGQPFDGIIEHLEFVEDRPGHDFRYAVDPSRAESELDWSPSVLFDDGLRSTVSWYLAHSDWIDDTLRSSAQWFESHYA